jgi:hypothetical protein
MFPNIHVAWDACNEKILDFQNNEDGHAYFTHRENVGHG